MALQQQKRLHQKLSLVLCCATILVLCGFCTATGNGNLSAARNHNYTNDDYATEQRTRRDVAKTEAEIETKTETAQSTPNNKLNPEVINGKQILASQSNNFVQNYDNPFRELNIIKRAPNGFIGMRGKKEYLDDEYNQNSFDLDLDPLYRNIASTSIDNQDYQDDDAYENQRFKKAPTAFYGVRGKKFPHNSGSYSQLNDLVQQLAQEDLREQIFEDFLGRLVAATEAQNEIIKRTPTGFQGLRGKRPVGVNWRQFDNVRYDDAAEKRAPANSFVGVRGKKDVNHQPETEEHQALFKRSPSESFGGGGKRRFADFNNKFVAVRGKKDVTSVNSQSDAMDEQPADYNGARQNFSFYTAGAGMRGKRAAANEKKTSSMDSTNS